jgi:hypothetical protein
MNGSIALNPAAFGSYTSSPSVSDHGKSLVEIMSALWRRLFERTVLGRCLEESLDRLVEVYVEASEPNWDGYGADPLTEQSLRNAAIFLCTLPSGLPTPDISADAQGEFHFEWFSNPYRTFSVSIGSKGVASYAGLFGTSRTRGLEFQSSWTTPNIVSNIKRVFE